VLVSFWHYKQVETAVSVEFVSFLPGNEWTEQFIQNALNFNVN
jgi:hypothetical protein